MKRANKKREKSAGREILPIFNWHVLISLRNYGQVANC